MQHVFSGGIRELPEPGAVIEDDPADNGILECALAADAELVATGDKKHLLPLGSLRGCPSSGWRTSSRPSLTTSVRGRDQDITRPLDTCFPVKSHSNRFQILPSARISDMGYVVTSVPGNMGRESVHPEIPGALPERNSL